MPKESNAQRNYQNEILAHQNFNEFLPKTSATLPKNHKRQNADESFALISISI